MTAHSELVARLEGASEGSRELDALVWLRFNRPEYTGGVKALEMRGWYDGRGHLILETDAGEEVADDLPIGHVTTSLDAALALAERVYPDGWLDLYIRGGKASAAQCFEGNRAYTATHASNPIAVCIAVLRAQPQPDGEKT